MTPRGIASLSLVLVGLITFFLIYVLPHFVEPQIYQAGMNIIVVLGILIFLILFRPPQHTSSSHRRLSAFRLFAIALMAGIASFLFLGAMQHLIPHPGAAGATFVVLAAAAGFAFAGAVLGWGIYKRRK